MIGRLFGRFAGYRDIQAPADHLRDLAERYAFICDRVIAGSRRVLPEDEPVKTGGIQPVHRGPAIHAIPT